MTTEDLLDGLVLQNDQLEEELEGANAEIVIGSSTHTQNNLLACCLTSQHL